MESFVAVIPCSDYDRDTVYAALKKGIDLLGGAGSFVSPGEKILLKPNMLAAREPDAAVTTHPEILAGAARIFKEAGAVLSYGDSPGTGNPRSVAIKTGLAAAASDFSVEMADFETFFPAGFPEGLRQKTFPLAAGVMAADGIISLSKMKTHQLTLITGAFKNQFGCLVGFEKANLHLVFPNVHHFCSMLADLNKLLKPRLYIMDGIVAMQGEGPSSGDPVHMDVLLLSRDPVALDAVFCRLIALDPELVPTITAGRELGIGTSDERDIRILGADISGLINPSFNVKREAIAETETLRSLSSLKQLLIRRPRIKSGLCIKCGVCVEACPVPGKALNFVGGTRTKPPVFDYSKCIRCFCCHEMCPRKAVAAGLPFLGKIFTLFLKLTNRRSSRRKAASRT